MKFSTLEHEKKLLGVDVEKGVRVAALWKAIVNRLFDDDIADEVAKKAFSMTPQSKELCEKTYAEVKAQQELERKKEMEQGFKELEEKYKVTRNNNATTHSVSDSVG